MARAKRRDAPPVAIYGVIGGDFYKQWFFSFYRANEYALNLAASREYTCNDIIQIVRAVLKDDVTLGMIVDLLNDDRDGWAQEHSVICTLFPRHMDDGELESYLDYQRRELATPDTPETV
jgi:hypothetical protein